MKELTLNYNRENESPLKNEEDFKLKILVPFVKTLGFSDSEIEYEVIIPVQVGTRSVNARADVVISIDKVPVLVIDAKNPNNTLRNSDALQAASYAKLVTTPPAIFGIATNGISTICTNVLSGQRSNEIPTRTQLISALNRFQRRSLTDVQLREVKSTLITLLSREDLYKVIEKSKNVIERIAGIRTDKSFREMTKVLLVKMAEEKRALSESGDNRFAIAWLNAYANANEISIFEAFKTLFDEACVTYPGIYQEELQHLELTDNDCIREIVQQLEDFSLLGTGDDIKGAVYEIFLKETLRGDFDQYFTPREIVDFIVQFADPKAGTKLLDPACGSGGFLIQAFRFVNQKIVDDEGSEIERKKKFKELVDKSLWGVETDYDLHILAKINLIMHGDGWNHIFKGDALKSNDMPSGTFDLVLSNPPFTLPYEVESVLAKYELGIGRSSQELDILFVERSLEMLRPGGELFIVLPESMANIGAYTYFREWLLEKAYIVLSVSLPEQTFVPFGKSVSKTCILGLRKKDDSLPAPTHAFVGRATHIGYETGKKTYKPIGDNNLVEFLDGSKEFFEGVRKCNDRTGEYGWVPIEQIGSVRIDAGYLLNLLDRDALMRRFPNVVPLREVCDVRNIKARIDASELYPYIEVPDIGISTGSLTNIRRKFGSEFTVMYEVGPGDLVFVRINPRQNRVLVVPHAIGERALISTETHRLVLKEDSPFNSPHSLASILRMKEVVSQTSRIGTGGSSSRSRVQPDDLLDEVFIPIPEPDVILQVEKILRDANEHLWKASDNYLNVRQHVSELLGDLFDRDLVPRV